MTIEVRGYREYPIAAEDSTTDAFRKCIMQVNEMNAYIEELEAQIRLANGRRIMVIE